MGIMQAAVANLPLGTGILVPMVPWQVDTFGVGAAAAASLTVGTDGSLVWTASRTTRTGSPRWYNPITALVGNSYWVRVTQTTSYGGGFSGAAVGSWLALTSARTWNAIAPAGSNVDVGAIFNLDFASDAIGTTIVGQMTGNRMTAFSFSYDNPGGI